MTGEKFTEIVTKRANERVQVKLAQFKKAIKHAFYELTGSDYTTRPENRPSDRAAANNQILLHMAETFELDPSGNWPSILWRQEEEKVSDELLSMMDEMQKALLSPGPQKGDCTAAAEKVKAEE